MTSATIELVYSRHPRTRIAHMRRRFVLASLSLLAAAALAGCGQKGPLTLPPTKPAVKAPASAASTVTPAPAVPEVPPPATSGGM